MLLQLRRTRHLILTQDTTSWGMHLWRKLAFHNNRTILPLGTSHQRRTSHAPGQLTALDVIKLTTTSNNATIANYRFIRNALSHPHLAVYHIIAQTVSTGSSPRSHLLHHHTIPPRLRVMVLLSPLDPALLTRKLPSMRQIIRLFLCRIRPNLNRKRENCDHGKNDDVSQPPPPTIKIIGLQHENNG